MNLDNQNIPDLNTQWEIDPDVLGVLRGNAEFSFEGNERVQTLLEAIHSSCADLITEFVGIEVRVEDKQAELLKVDLNAPDDQQVGETVIAKVEGDQDALLYVLSINSVDFKKILQIALSGKFDEASNNSEKPLTEAEKKILIRLYNQIAENLFGNFEALSILGVPRRPFEISKEEFNGAIELNQLAKLTMKFISCKTDFQVSLSVPLELLTFEPQVELAPEEIKAMNKLERDWKNNLRNSIEELPIKLNAKVLDAEVSLSEVSQLSVGDMMNITFGEQPVPISFDDGMQVFMGRTELQENELFLRVTSGIES